MIYQGDCLAILPTLPADHFDSIVTDPPYHLTTGKKGGTGPASVNLESPYVGTGFMGMKWDGGDVAFRPELWAEALRVAKPGAYLAAFGGTRTFHRMACAIEDAGWEIRDTLMWVYGSGFPKSHNGEWGGTALKPAWEPIILARKPFKGTVEANWQQHRTGGLHIDRCRIPSEERAPVTGRGGIPARSDESTSRPSGVVEQPHALGRWPANVLHDGSNEVVAAFPTAPGQQAPVSTSASASRFFYCAKASREDRDSGLEHGPKRLFGMSGAAAAAAARGEHYDNGDGGVNKTKLVGNFHPTVKPTELMRWLCRLVTPRGGGGA